MFNSSGIQYFMFHSHFQCYSMINLHFLWEGVNNQTQFSSVKSFIWLKVRGSHFRFINPIYINLVSILSVASSLFGRHVFIHLMPSHMSLEPSKDIVCKWDNEPNVNMTFARTRLDCVQRVTDRLSVLLIRQQEWVTRGQPNRAISLDMQITRFREWWPTYRSA